MEPESQNQHAPTTVEKVLTTVGNTVEAIYGGVMAAAGSAMLIAEIAAGSTTLAASIPMWTGIAAIGAAAYSFYERGRMNQDINNKLSAEETASVDWFEVQSKADNYTTATTTMGAFTGALVGTGAALALGASLLPAAIITTTGAAAVGGISYLYADIKRSMYYKALGYTEEASGRDRWWWAHVVMEGISAVSSIVQLNPFGFVSGAEAMLMYRLNEYLEEKKLKQDNVQAPTPVTGQAFAGV